MPSTVPVPGSPGSRLTCAVTNAAPALAESRETKYSPATSVTADTVPRVVVKDTGGTFRLPDDPSREVILVGPGTVQRVASLVHLEEAGELSLKNHAPVQAFRVLRLLA